jgi:hypothetical protein
MPFNTEFGYVPETVNALIARLVPYINVQFGTTYTYESFQGTNFYRFVYSIAQLMYETEVDTGEIYNKLQDYFRITNEQIEVPRTPLQGLIEEFDKISLDASFDQSTPGELGTCVNVGVADIDAGANAALKASIIEVLALYTVAGLTYAGAKTGNYTFSNGQTFAYKFDVPVEVPVLIRATITISTNNQSRVFTTEEVRTIIDDNIKEKYALGNNFEPEKYLTAADVPFAATILVEYSLDDGSNYLTEVYEADFKDLITYDATDDIEVIIS